MLESVREAGVGYRLLNLLAFYRATVGQLAGLDSPVLEALSECRKNADDTFRHAMKREVRCGRWFWLVVLEFAVPGDVCTG